MLIVLILASVINQFASMCSQKTYIGSHYHSALYGTAPFILGELKASSILQLDDSMFAF